MSFSRLHQFFSWICQHFSLPQCATKLFQSSYIVLFVDSIAAFLALPLVLWGQLGSDLSTYSFLYILKNSFCLSVCSLGFFTLFQTYTYPFERVDVVYVLKQLSAIILCTMTFVPLTVLLSQEEELPGLSVLLTGITMIGLTFLPRGIAFIVQSFPQKGQHIPQDSTPQPSATILPCAHVNHERSCTLPQETLDFLSNKKILLLNGKASFLSTIIRTLSPHLHQPLNVIHSSFETVQEIQNNTTDTYPLQTHVCDITDHSLMESIIETIKPDVFLLCMHPTWMGDDNTMHYLRTYILSTEFLSFVIPQAALLLHDDHTAHHLIPMIKAAFMRFSQEGSSQYLLLSNDSTSVPKIDEERMAIHTMQSFFALQHDRDILEYTLFEPSNNSDTMSDNADIASSYPSLTPHEYTAWIHTPSLELLLQAIDQCHHAETLKVLQNYHAHTLNTESPPPPIAEQPHKHSMDDTLPANDDHPYSSDTRSAS